MLYLTRKMSETFTLHGVRSCYQYLAQDPGTRRPLVEQEMELEVPLRHNWLLAGTGLTIETTNRSAAPCDFSASVLFLDTGDLDSTKYKLEAALRECRSERDDLQREVLLLQREVERLRHPDPAPAGVYRGRTTTTSLVPVVATSFDRLTFGGTVSEWAKRFA